MIKAILLIVLVLGFFYTSNAQDFKVIAQEYCDCFRLRKDTRDKEFLDIMIRISGESKMYEALRKEIVQLSKEKRGKFKEQMDRLAEEITSTDSEAGLCGFEMGKKYRSSKSKIIFVSV